MAACCASILALSASTSFSFARLLSALDAVAGVDDRTDHKLLEPQPAAPPRLGRWTVLTRCFRLRGYVATTEILPAPRERAFFLITISTS
jgi:hypothetical protein